MTCLARAGFILCVVYERGVVNYEEAFYGLLLNCLEHVTYSYNLVIN